MAAVQERPRHYSVTRMPPDEGLSYHER
jgi:hypothetical protein